MQEAAKRRRIPIRMQDQERPFPVYNAERPHLSLKYKTPDEVHRAS